MDLNFQYSEHQRSLMRASRSDSRLTRARHLAAAGVIANRIRDYQLRQGAAASSGWLDSMGEAGCSIGRAKGLAA
ncbi:MAG: hypothetical protein KGM17_00040 [Sphingomonadales bacterium]|nr:hypothetical protein [Sphingomonadales bacterium]